MLLDFVVHSHLLPDSMGVPTFLSTIDLVLGTENYLSGKSNSLSIRNLRVTNPQPLTYLQPYIDRLLEISPKGRMLVE